MRIGSNPFKSEKHSVYTPKDITIAILVYIPYLWGYFEHKFEILKVSLASLIKHSDLPCDLLVFDNGSCSEVIRYLSDLHARRLIRFLVLAEENLGVMGAYNMIFPAAPGKYVAYADDDIFYYPQWLSNQIRILEAFPRAGMVSGLPTWQNFCQYTGSNATEANADPSITVERMVGWRKDWADDYAESIGWDLNGFTKMCKDVEVTKLTRNGISAFGTCTHCQFVTSKLAAGAVLPIDPEGKAMWRVMRFDEKMDKAGFMRLSTTRPYVRHMGNRLSTKTREDVSAVRTRFGASGTCND